jgi:hypothetical protein
MALPIEKSKPDFSLDKQVILIYGRAKIGKSTLCSKFENALFLATEPGLNKLEVYSILINSWEKFLEACREIAEGKHAFKTIVVDTVDNLVILCADYICRQHNINHAADLPHGKGWHFVTSELTRAITKLSLLPYGLIMTSHCDMEEIETKTKKYNRWTISVSGKNRGVFLNMADIILFVDSEMDKDGNERRLIRTKPSLYWEAGDRNNLLPETIPLSYNELVKYFNVKQENKEVEIKKG